MRFVLVALGAAALWSGTGEMLLAADAPAWPDYDIPFHHGIGYYLSLWKMAPIWLLFAAWVHTTDWVSRDTKALRLNYSFWNNLVVFAFFAAFVLVWMMPGRWSFWLTFPILILTYAIPLGVYVRERNSQVPFGEQVLTKRHLKKWFVAKLVLLHLKKGDDDGEEGPDVQFKALGAASDSDNSVNLLTAKENPGFLPARQLMADAIVHRATSVMLEYTAEAAEVRHQVDGVWHDQPPIDRAMVGDPVLEVFKTLANCNPTDRAARQAGSLAVETKAGKYVIRFTSQGTKTGERAVLQMEGKKLGFGSLEELGMRPKMVEQAMEMLNNKGGILVFTTLPGGGLSTLVDVALNATDRFTRNFAAVQEVTSTEREILNVPITTFSAAEGESPATILPKLIRTYPDVIVVRDLVNLETLEILLHQATQEQRLCMTTLRSKDAVEALVRLLQQYKMPPSTLAPALLGVVNMRLVRKLCETCREAYPPPPEVLKQMGVPAGKIEAFYRPPTEPIDPKHPEVVCDQCQGIGYLGRTGIFELLTVEETLREALATSPKLENLRVTARRAGHRALQDEGLLLVARGVTSLQELLRVLKQ